MISKNKSICFYGLRFSKTALLFFIPIILTIMLLPAHTRSEGLKGVVMQENDKTGQVRRFKTSLGELKAKFLMVNGNRISVVGNKMGIKEGYFAMGLEEAFHLGSSVNIFKGKPQQQINPLELTLVQDQASGDWLATNGLLFISDDKSYLVEGQRLKVVGGKDKPVLIGEQPFADVTLVISNGKPVKKAW